MSIEHGYHYSGKELDAFSYAKRWKRYWWGQIRPFVGCDILEVGAGCGNNVGIFNLKPGIHYTGIEPDQELADVLKLRLDEMSFEKSSVVVGCSGQLVGKHCFDTVVYLDVLEHIEDDKAELRLAFDLLREGGHLIILSPAYQWLYSAFDRSVGHWRRYNVAALKSVIPEGGIEVRVRHLDSVGLLASVAMKIFSRSGKASKGSVTIWDRMLVPISRCVDPLMRYWLGRSLLVIVRKDVVRKENIKR